MGRTGFRAAFIPAAYLEHYITLSILGKTGFGYCCAGSRFLCQFYRTCAGISIEKPYRNVLPDYHWVNNSHIFFEQPFRQCIKYAPINGCSYTQTQQAAKTGWRQKSYF
jgi:hypothetical protein